VDTPDEEPAAFLWESDRVAESLPAMEDHPGHRLLRGAVLMRASARRWEAANAGDHPPVPGRDVAGALDGLRRRFPDVAESEVAAVETAVGAEVARAREVLSGVPCDLNTAAVAVLRYQRMVLARTEAR
jgi:hypothetical protein